MFNQASSDKANNQEYYLETKRGLLCAGSRNNDTINILITSYVLGFDWTHGFEIIAKNVEFNSLSQDELEEMSEVYEEYVHDTIGRPYSRLDWIEQIIHDNPDNWEEILISKLM